jgi:hypothetical protein
MDYIRTKSLNLCEVIMKKIFFILLGIMMLNFHQHVNAQYPNQYHLPILKTSNDTVDGVFHIALGNILSNIRIRGRADNAEVKPLLWAGLDYGGAWTRDAAINVWNGAGLLFPDVSKNTLMELLRETDGKLIVTGQYWDKMIWSSGAWNYYLYTGDKEFLSTAYEAIVNTIGIMEKDEFDPNLNLFRGAAVMGDGIGAYDDKYTNINGYDGNVYTTASIEKWARSKDNANKRNPAGGGLPMMCLSTNCVYYETYQILSKMERTLGKKVDPLWQTKAENLKASINKHLWNPEKGTYSYYLDPWGKCDYQEGMGISFAILFGVADKDQQEMIFKNTYTAPAGIPMLWPCWPRYYNEKDQTYGRFSSVMNMVQGFWAKAAAQNGQSGRFFYDFKQLTINVWRDKQFREIYHPVTGLPYGGLMENIHVRPLGSSIHEFESTNIQTWGATAYLSMVLNGLAGMEFSESGINFHPFLPGELRNFSLLNMPYRNTVLNINIKGNGNVIESFMLNGKASKPFIGAEEKGVKNIVITLKQK